MTGEQSILYRFGESETLVHFCRGIDAEVFTSDSGLLRVYDANTVRLGCFQAFGRRIVLPAGERSKSWGGARRVLRAALRAGLGRDGLIVGVGGGMICDLAAFAASLYMRGCRLQLVPTTLLAMVDAALGGKTGINFGGYKNTAGTFYPAEQIWVDPAVLEHLPDREFRSGLGEVIKTALLGDRDLLAILQSESGRVLARERRLMERIVGRCLAVKAGIVAEDLRESGRRAVLNLGHTFAHALEARTHYRLWSHGQAVAWGLVQAAALSRSLGLAEEGYTEEVRRLVDLYGFELRSPCAPEKLVPMMQADKKNRAGKLRLVLQRGIGDTVIREVDPQAIVEILGQTARSMG